MKKATQNNNVPIGDPPFQSRGTSKNNVPIGDPPIRNQANRKNNVPIGDPPFDKTPGTNNIPIGDPPELDPGGAEEMPAPEESGDAAAQMRDMGAITVKRGDHIIHCLTIIGQIEGHYILPPQNKTTKYEHVIPQLVAIEESLDIEGLVIILNTVGGDVEAGLAIAELIAGMKKPTVSLVLGGGHSIGVPLAVSARRSFIAPSATMTIHPVRMSGLVLGVPQTFSYFQKMQERITRFVMQNSDISAARFNKLMLNTGELVTDVGTVLDGERAVNEGLIDNIGGLSDALACLYGLISGTESSEKPAAKKRKPKK